MLPAAMLLPDTTPTRVASPFGAYGAPVERPAPIAAPSSPLTGSWTVYEVLRHYPLALLTFVDFGIDTWSNALVSLDATAGGAGIAPDRLLAALVPCTIEDEDVDVAMDGVDEPAGASAVTRAP